MRMRTWSCSDPTPSQESTDTNDYEDAELLHDRQWANGALPVVLV